MKNIGMQHAAGQKQAQHIDVRVICHRDINQKTLQGEGKKNLFFLFRINSDSHWPIIK